MSPDYRDPRGKVPNNFDDDLWKSEGSDLSAMYQEVRNRILGKKEKPYVIGPRQNIIHLLPHFSRRGKIHRRFRGGKESVFLISDYPPCEALLVYTDRDNGLYLEHEIYLQTPDIDSVKPYAKSLFLEARKMKTLF